MFLFRAEVDITTDNYDAFLKFAGPEQPAPAKPGSPKEPKPATQEQPAPVKPDALAEDIRTIATRLVRTGRQEELRTLLDKYGAPRLTAVEPRDYAAFKSDLEAING